MRGLLFSTVLSVIVQNSLHIYAKIFIFPIYIVHPPWFLYFVANPHQAFEHKSTEDKLTLFLFY